MRVIVICKGDKIVKKELSIKQKNADKDLNIIVYSTLIPLIVYLIFGNNIMNYATLYIHFLKLECNHMFYNHP